MTTFGSRDHAKCIQVRYLTVNVPSPYNIIIGIPSFNALKAVLSTLYLTLKYRLEDDQVGIVKGDQGIARKCYKDSPRLKLWIYDDEPIKSDQLKVNSINIDLREELPKNQLTHRRNTWRMQNNVWLVHPTQIGVVHISKDENGNVGVNLSIRHQPLAYEVISWSTSLLKHKYISYLLQSFGKVRHSSKVSKHL